MPTALFVPFTNLHLRERYCSGIFYQFIIQSITVRFAQSKLSQQYLNQRRNHCVRSICSIILFVEQRRGDEKRRREKRIECICMHFVRYMFVVQPRQLRFDSDKCRLVLNAFNFLWLRHTSPLPSSSSSACSLFYIFYKFIVAFRCCCRSSLGRSSMTRRPNRDKCSPIHCECELTFVHRSWHFSFLYFFSSFLHTILSLDRLHFFEFPRIKKFIFKR